MVSRCRRKELKYVIGSAVQFRVLSSLNNGKQLFGHKVAQHWTLHSGRNCVPAATAALCYTKGDRDLLGGWSKPVTIVLGGDHDDVACSRGNVFPMCPPRGESDQPFTKLELWSTALHRSSLAVATLLSLCAHPSPDEECLSVARTTFDSIDCSSFTAPAANFSGIRYWEA